MLVGVRTVFPIPQILLLDGLDHGQAHVDAVAGVLGSADGEAGDAVVAVPEDLDPHALRARNQGNSLGVWSQFFIIHNEFIFPITH